MWAIAAPPDSPQVGLRSALAVSDSESSRDSHGDFEPDESFGRLSSLDPQSPQSLSFVSRGSQSPESSFKQRTGDSAELAAATAASEAGGELAWLRAALDGSRLGETPKTRNARMSGRREGQLVDERRRLARVDALAEKAQSVAILRASDGTQAASRTRE